MNRLTRLVNRFRAWRLQRWAADLQREADYHKHAATEHSYAAATCKIKSDDIRTQARRIRAAGSVA